jgi:hypothetical protein
MQNIEFKIWLNESRIDELTEALVSWMSFLGDFIPTEGKTHVVFSKELVPNAKNEEEARDILFKKNYMRINFSNGIVYANNPYKQPNPTQKRDLKDFAIEFNKIQEYDFIKEIVYDNDRSTQVIWSSQDA